MMHAVIEKCVSDAGNLAQAFGLGRVVGQIYAYLYFSPTPCGLSDMQEALGISKGSASMCVRQLEQWGAVNKVWVKGDRRDYYRANDWFGKVLKNVINDVMAGRFSGRESFYADLESNLGQGDDSEQEAFIRERLAHIRAFEEKARKMWENPLVQHFLK
jgi:DNA-binding transcriptional regulator GbsR (MarR family)